MLRILFVGQNILGGTALSVLASQGVRPLLVITRQDNDYPNLVETSCQRHHLSLIKTDSLDEDTALVRTMKQLEPDIIFCCAWKHRIRNSLLALPQHGWVNLHPSYLPRYRGPHPVEWQIINGDSEAGGSAHRMTERFDDGPILFQEKIPIGFHDTSETLRLSCGQLLGRLALRCYERLSTEPRFEGTNQSEALANYTPNRETARKINWQNQALTVYNVIRGLSPYPCAYLLWGNDPLLIAEAEITSIVSSETSAGTGYLNSDQQLMVGTRDYYLKINGMRIDNRIVKHYWPSLPNKETLKRVNFGE